MARHAGPPKKSRLLPPNYITPEGCKKLGDKLDLMRADRRRVVAAITIAAAEGDRSENAEYIYGKKRLRQLDQQMTQLSERLDAVVVVDPRVPRGDKVYFGATVVLEDEDGDEVTYQLVGEDETEAATGRISWRSPVGQALLGRTVHDEVKVTTPAGRRVLTVVEVCYR